MADEDDDRTCPDGGRCHHDCGLEYCYRVENAGPLSGVYDGDEWPIRVRLALAPRLVAGSATPTRETWVCEDCGWTFPVAEPPMGAECDNCGGVLVAQAGSAAPTGGA